MPVRGFVFVVVVGCRLYMLTEWCVCPYSCWVHPPTTLPLTPHPTVKNPYPNTSPPLMMDSPNLNSNPDSDPNLYLDRVPLALGSEW